MFPSIHDAAATSNTESQRPMKKITVERQTSDGYTEWVDMLVDDPDWKPDEDAAKPAPRDPLALLNPPPAPPVSDVPAPAAAAPKQRKQSNIMAFFGGAK